MTNSVCSARYWYRRLGLGAELHFSEIDNVDHERTLAGQG